MKERDATHLEFADGCSPKDGYVVFSYGCPCRSLNELSNVLNQKFGIDLTLINFNSDDYVIKLERQKI